MHAEFPILELKHPLKNSEMATLPVNPIATPRFCFSFAAYVKNVMESIKNSDIPVLPGLTDEEFTSTESLLGIKFPPDLRLFLREGLPIGPGFPNWRSSSAQQLQILTNLPLLGLLKEVSKDRFWVESWPEKPEHTANALKMAKKLLQKVPVLLPIYRYCYIPCTPCLGGNPIFYINGGEIRVLSFDLTGFFHQVDFRVIDSVVNRRPSLGNLFKLPAWAAEEARVIEFWSDLAAYGRTPRDVQSIRGRNASGQGWWSGELVGCMEGVRERLRDGGWEEEEVREMMMVMDGEDRSTEVGRVGGKEEVAGHVRVLSVTLLRAGWSQEDVVDSLGCDTEPSSWLEYQHTSHCVLEVV